jgi:hypothetical protein
MCAIDALGISAMLGRHVTITAAEPGTGGSSLSRSTVTGTMEAVDRGRVSRDGRRRWCASRILRVHQFLRQRAAARA